MDIGDKYGKKGVSLLYHKYLKKKVPKTNKYADVESKLKSKTGKTIHDVDIISNYPLLQVTSS